MQIKVVGVRADISDEDLVMASGHGEPIKIGELAQIVNALKSLAQEYVPKAPRMGKKGVERARLRMRWEGPLP